MKFVVLVAVVAGLVTFTDLDLRDGRDLPGHGVDVTAAHDTQPFLSEVGAAVPRPDVGRSSASGAIVTTTTTVVPGVNCPEWSTLAVEAGLAPEDMKRWDLIMWRESRCLPDAHNPSDPNSGSYGLVQVNGFWCRPSTYHPDGWLQEQGIVGECDDLYDPLTNLRAAAAIFDYSADRNRCGWLPWTTRNTRWC